MYAVMGITGNVGGAVARTLLAKGEKIRGIVRNPEKAAEWQKQGVELFKAGYDDVDALTAAFTGVAGVFVMVPANFAPAPGFAETKATLKVLHEALSRALPSKAGVLCPSRGMRKSGCGRRKTPRAENGTGRVLEMTVSDRRRSCLPAPRR